MEGRITLKEPRVEIEGPISMRTLIKLQEKSGEIVKEVLSAVGRIEEVAYAGNPEQLKQAAENYSKVCEKGIETIRHSFPEILIDWSSNHLIKSLEEGQLSGQALMEGNQQGFSEHFQKSAELMDRQNMFLEALKTNFESLGNRHR